MKKITLLWVVCLITFVGATTVHAQNPTVLCSGFETEDFADVWTNDFGDLVSVVSGDQYSGTKSCKLITDASSQLSEVYQKVEITAGKAYTLSIYNKLLNNGGNGAAMLGYIFLDESGSNMTEFVSVPMTSTQGAWVKSSLSTDIAPAGAVYIWFDLQVTGGAGTSILFDDASITLSGGATTKTAQTITGLSAISKTASDVDFDMAATASSNLAVTYTSSNTAVATVSGSKVHIVGAGVSTITASQAGNDTYAVAPDVTATLTVAPTAVAVTSVTLNTSTLALVAGGSQTLTATVTPDNATNKSVSWTSNNTAVATVDNTGKVTALTAGTATITVTTTDGSKTATCIVTVSAAISYTWLLAPAIAIEGTNLKVVGTDADKFTLFYINDQATTATGGVVSLAGKTGDLSLKATTADGTGLIKLKVNLAPKTAVKDGVEVIKLNVNNKQLAVSSKQSVVSSR